MPAFVCLPVIPAYRPAKGRGMSREIEEEVIE